MSSRGIHLDISLLSEPTVGYLGPGLCLCSARRGRGERGQPLKLSKLSPIKALTPPGITSKQIPNAAEFESGTGEGSERGLISREERQAADPGCRAALLAGGQPISCGAVFAS